MKTPQAKKLPSGNWNCRVRVRGQDVSITRPTAKEAVAEAMAVKAGIRLADQHTSQRRSGTVSQAIDDYIAARENVLSPSTIRGYRSIQRTRFRQAMPLRIADISDEKWQQIVNLEKRTCSAKTLKNAWFFLSSVITSATGRHVTVRLSQVVEKDLPYLSSEQIPIFINALRGQSFEIPALLALTGLRRSEILALRWENVDLVRNTILVSGAAVVDSENNLVQKEANKNKSSRRVIPIIPPLEAALKERCRPSGFIVTTSPNTLYLQINRLCQQNGLPEVGVHGLRRSFASLAYHLGLSEEVTMRIGGWSNIYTMRKIYTKVSALDIANQSAKLQNYFAEISGF